MAELTPTYDEQPVKAIIVTVDTGEFDAELSLGELEELAHTAGAEVVGSVLQKRPSPDTATYIGSGRLEELVPQIEALEADLLIFDCELTANQTKTSKRSQMCVLSTAPPLFLIYSHRGRFPQRDAFRSSWHSRSTALPTLRARACRCHDWAAVSEPEAPVSPSLKPTGDISAAG